MGTDLPFRYPIPFFGCRSPSSTHVSPPAQLVATATQTNSALIDDDMDTLAERLRRRPAKPKGSPRVGSNPTGVACWVTQNIPTCYSTLMRMKRWLSESGRRLQKAGRPAMSAACGSQLSSGIAPGACRSLPRVTACAPAEVHFANLSVVMQHQASAPCGDRTHDHTLTEHMLYQLS